MTTIQATVQNGRIDVPAPPELADGTKVQIDVTPLPQIGADEIRFMSEDEQSDDPEAIERWIAELDALPGVTMTPEQEAEMLAWREKEREYNLDVARREIEGEAP